MTAYTSKWTEVVVAIVCHSLYPRGPLSFVGLSDQTEHRVQSSQSANSLGALGPVDGNVILMGDKDTRKEGSSSPRQLVSMSRREHPY